MRRPSIVWLGVAFELGLLLLAVLLGWLLGVPWLERLRLRAADLLWGVLATVPLLAGLWGSTRARRGPVARLLREIERTAVPLFAGRSAREFALLALAAGVAEETLFRGVLQTALAEPAGALTALFATSAAFGVAHLVTPSYAVVAGIMGAYLGALLLATGNLLVPITVHALYDFVALMVLTRRRGAGAAAPPPLPR